MGNQMEELKKEVMDLLRYGTVGNLTKEMADQLLLQVVNEDDSQNRSQYALTTKTIPRI